MSPESAAEEPAESKGAHISALSSMLASRWKSGMRKRRESAKGHGPQRVRFVSSKKLDIACKEIELRLAG